MAVSASSTTVRPLRSGRVARAPGYDKHLAHRPAKRQRPQHVATPMVRAAACQRGRPRDRRSRHPPRARRRAAHRRRLRRGVRRGQAHRRPPCSTTARSRSSTLGPRPRRRHPGRRRRHHRLRPHRRPHRGRACRRRPRRPRPRPGAAAAAPARSPSTPAERAAPNEVDDLPGRRGQGPQGRAAAPGRRGRPRPQGGAITPGVGRATATAAAASWSPTATACSPTTTRCARCSRCQCVATGDTGMQTGLRVASAAPSASSCSTAYDVEELARTAAGRALTKLDGPARPERHSCRSSSARAAAACCSTRRAATASRPTSSSKGASVFAGRVGEQVAVAARHPRRRRHHGRRVGRASPSTTRATPAQRNVLIEDGVLTDYMWDLLRARKEGRASVGQRPAPELPAPADGAHDQHLPARRRRRPRRHHRRHRPRRLRAPHLGGGQVNTATGDFVFGMTEAYLIENGEITEPLREGNLIGNGPEVLRRIDAVGNDFAMGPPGTCGKDGQGVPVGDGAADAAGAGADRRRHRGVSDELLRHRRPRDRRAWPSPASRSRRSSPAAATPRSGPTRARSSRCRRPSRGRRRPGDRRRPPGLRLRRHASTTTCWPRRWPRPATTPASPRPTSTSAWPSPTASAVPDARPVPRRRSPSFPTDAQGRAGARARAGGAGRRPPHPGVESAELRRRRWRGRRGHHHRHPHRRAATTVVLRRDRTPGRRRRRDADRLRLLGRARARRARHRRRRPPRPSSGPPACSAPRKPPSRAPDRGARPVRHRASSSASSAARSTGEAVLKGRSLFADRLGEEVGLAAASPSSTTRPNPLAFTAAEHRRRGPGHAGATSLIDGGVLQRLPAQHATPAGARARRPPAPRCGAVQVARPASGCRPLSLAPRHRDPGRAARRRRRRRAGAVESPACTRGSTRSAATSPPAPRGCCIRDGELAEPVREVTIASTLQRMLHDVVAVGADLEWLPMSARRREPRRSATSPSPVSDPRTPSVLVRLAYLLGAQLGRERLGA